jgi:hypothetical protein
MSEDKFREALQQLVNKLDEVHADLAYKTVWMIHQTHVGPYRGPTYVDALTHARNILEMREEPQP